MPDIHHILAVAKVETKLLLRTKVIKIYGVFIFLIALLNILENVIDGNQLSTMPGEYATKYFFWSSLFKIVLSPFIVPVFIHDDRHFDSFTSLYPRPFSNTSYLFGKLAGCCKVLVGGDYVFMVLLALFDIFVNHHTFSLWPYLFYPLIVTLPLCIFVFGLHTLSGYVRYPLVFAGTILMMMVLIPLEDTERVRYLDLGAITLPLAYSAFTGFTQLGTILIQRMIFALGGMGLLFGAIVVSEHTRRSNQPRENMVFIVLTLVFLGAGTGCAWLDQKQVYDARRYRDKLRAYHNLLSQAPAIRVMSCDLHVTHKNDVITASAHLSITNPNDTAVDSVVLKLNPGFSVTGVNAVSQPLAYSFEKGVLVVEPDTPLPAGDSLELDIAYNGAIDSKATYLHIPEDFRVRARREGLMVLGKEVSCITKKYVLLPPEAHWYPEALPACPVTEPGYLQRDLTRFTLTVRSGNKMVALSQGEKTGESGDVQTFVPEKPLTQLSLAIAPFKKTSMVVDDVEYAYYWVYRDVVGEAAFTTRDLETAISEFRQDIESRIGFAYPFGRYQLVQAPAHYFGYNSPWDMNSAWEQPETRFISEAPLFYGHLTPEDFGTVYSRTQVERLHMRVLRRLGGTNPLSTEISRKINRKSVFLSFKGLDEFVANPFSDHSGIYSQFAVFTRGRLTQNDLFNLIAVHQLKNTIPILSWVDDVAYTPFSASYYSLDRARYHFLSGMSLDDIIHETRFHTEALDVVPLAAQSFFKLYSQKLDIESITVETLLLEGFSCPDTDVPAMFSEKHGIDILEDFEDFAHRKEAAKYEFSDVRLVRYFTGDRHIYNARCTIRNTTPFDGVITCRANEKDTRNRYVMDVYFEPFSIKEIGMTTGATISSMNFEWIPFSNVERSSLYIRGPSQSKGFRFQRELQGALDEQPLNGIRDMGTEHVTQIVMDNLDEHCRVVSDTKLKFMKRLFSKRQKNGSDLRLSTFDGLIKPVNWRFAYPEYEKVFYGPLSAVYYKGSGDGNNAIEYEVGIPEPGQYTVSISVPSYPDFMFSEVKGLFDSGELGETTVRVYADDGMHEDTTDICKASKANQAWAHVGMYSFSDSTAIIQITDKSRVDFVVADAIRLVKVEE